MILFLGLDHQEQETTTNDASADATNVHARSAVNLEIGTYVVIHWINASNTLIWYLGEP